MKKRYEDVISSELGRIYPEACKVKTLFGNPKLKPIEINSALVSAQNRCRLYWTNINGIPQPEDKGILLQDIIENGNASYFIKQLTEKGYIVIARNQFTGRKDECENEIYEGDIVSFIPIEKKTYKIEYLQTGVVEWNVWGANWFCGHDTTLTVLRLLK